MAPLTRMRIGLVRMTIELLALCYILAWLWLAGAVTPAIVATLLAILRAGHIIAGVMGYASMVSSVRKAVGRG